MKKPLSRVGDQRWVASAAGIQLSVNPFFLFFLSFSLVLLTSSYPLFSCSSLCRVVVLFRRSVFVPSSHFFVGRACDFFRLF